jgi:cell division protease FtsH
MVGADLANLANEAALLAARREHEQVTMGDFTDALEKIELGTARKLLLTPADKRRTAYHEAATRSSGCSPRRRPGPEDLDHPAHDEPRRHDLGARQRPLQLRQGRACSPTSRSRPAGAPPRRSSTATRHRAPSPTSARRPQLARNMVGRFGMSDEIGFLSVLPQDGDGSALMPGVSEVSERTRQRSTTRCGRIVGEAHDEAVQLLDEHRDELDSLAEALYQAETLEGPEAYAAAGLEPRRDASPAEPATLVRA